MVVCHLTDRASPAATSPIVHYLTFLNTYAPVSCMRWLGNSGRQSSFYSLQHWGQPLTEDRPIVLILNQKLGSSSGRLDDQEHFRLLLVRGPSRQE